MSAILSVGSHALVVTDGIAKRMERRGREERIARKKGGREKRSRRKKRDLALNKSNKKRE